MKTKAIYQKPATEVACVNPQYLLTDGPAAGSGGGGGGGGGEAKEDFYYDDEAAGTADGGVWED